MADQTKQPLPLLPEPRHPVPPAPIHPLAALTTIVLDNISGAVELVDPLAILFTSLGVGGLGFLSTLFVQRFLARDGWGESVAKGIVMGIIAGVPYQVTGTAIGALLLGWAGASKWITLPGPRNQPELPPSDDEIVEAEAKDVN